MVAELCGWNSWRRSMTQTQKKAHLFSKSASLSFRSCGTCTSCLWDSERRVHPEQVHRGVRDREQENPNKVSFRMSGQPDVFLEWRGKKMQNRQHIFELRPFLLRDVPPPAQQILLNLKGVSCMVHYCSCLNKSQTFYSKTIMLKNTTNIWQQDFLLFIGWNWSLSWMSVWSSNLRLDLESPESINPCTLVETV